MSESRIGAKVTVRAYSGAGWRTVSAKIAGADPPANNWHYCGSGDDWHFNGTIAEKDLGVKWIVGWPDVDSDEVKALMVAAALSEEESVATTIHSGTVRMKPEPGDTLHIGSLVTISSTHAGCVRSARSSTDVPIIGRVVQTHTRHVDVLLASR